MPDARLLELEGAPDEQLAWLEGRLDAAAAEGVVRPLPAEGDQFATGKLAPGQLRVLRNRLFRLGYLRKDSEEDTVDRKLTRAIETFQKEADLEVDSWVGVQTWQALQELFAFEPSTDLGRWIEGRAMCPALRRAVVLRLHTYGLVEDAPTGDPGDEVVADALKVWARLLGSLGDGPAPIDDEPWTLWLLERMFDLDHLIALAHRNRGLVRARLARKGESGRGRLNRFLVSLIKIDLWLLGYEGVRPDGRLQEITHTKLRKRRGRPQKHRYSPLYAVIREFWEHRGLGDDHPSAKDEILGRTIRGLCEAQGTERATGRPRSRDVIAKLLRHGDDIDDRWRKTSVGARLWDGVKRAWRFVVGLFSKAKEAVERAVAALYRVAYGAALEAFSFVRRCLRDFVDSVELLWRPEIRGSSESIAMSHDRDFDFRVFVRAGAPRDKIDEFFAGLRGRLGVLHVTVRVLGMLLKVAIAAAKAVALPWGWWSLVRTLISLHGELREDDIRAIREPLPVAG